MAASEHTHRVAGRRRALLGAGAVVVAAVLLVGGFVLYARGGGRVPSWASRLSPVRAGLLDASTPAEQVLRTLRLAGVERAAVGADGSTVVLRIEVPAVESAADLTLAWQAGLGALLEAYPPGRARRYAVQLYGPGAEPLLQLAWDASEAEAAWGRGDAAALRDAAETRYLSGGEDVR